MPRPVEEGTIENQLWKKKDVLSESDLRLDSGWCFTARRIRTFTSELFSSIEFH